MYDLTRSAGPARNTLFALEPFERNGKANGKARRPRTTRDTAGGVRRQIRAVGERLAHEDAGELLLLLELGARSSYPRRPKS